MRRAVRFSCALLAQFLFFSTWMTPDVLQAQGAGVLRGAITDVAGAPVANADVTIVGPSPTAQSRTVTADLAGVYHIDDLPPGEYIVSVVAAGFATSDGHHVMLSATTPATADLTLPAIESGPSATPDAASAATATRTGGQQTNLAAEAGSGRDATAAVSVTRGVSQATTDVGGTAGAYAAQGNGLTVRGKAGVKRLFDGLRIENAEGLGSTSYMVNSAAVERIVVETGGGTADSPSAGGAINNVPKSGGDRYSFRLSGLLTTGAMQGSNLDDDLRARGLDAVNRVGRVWDVTFTAGGPIKRGSLWFFAAPKRWGNRNYAAGIYWNATQGTPFYTPDVSRPGDQLERMQSLPVRLTWQATSRDRINAFVDFPQSGCVCRGGLTTTAPEAASQSFEWGRKGHLGQIGLFQSTWSSTRSDRLLLDAGWSFMLGGFPQPYQPGVTPDTISITDIGTGFTWNERQGPHRGLASIPVNVSDRMSERIAASYVAGPHTVKFGVAAEHVWKESYNHVNGDVNYAYLNGTPVRVTQFSTPYTELARVNVELSAFAQDTWSLGRLTLNYGVRYNYFNAGVPPQRADATRFVPFDRQFDAVDCVPCWHDVDPRVGGAYDLFGSGRTVVKGSFGRFVSQQVLGLANANNPLNTSVNSVTRTWNDADGNYQPDCDLTRPDGNGECGPISNTAFGRNNPRATRYADDVIRGAGVRDYIWDSAIEVQQQLTPTVNVTAGYYRNWAANFITTRNEALDPATDFDPFCVTAPADPRLPGGGGYEVCGLYDVAPARFNAVENLVTQSSRFGRQRLVNDFFGFSLDARLPGGRRLGANVDTGRTVSNNCFVVNSPQQLTFNTSFDSALLGVGAINDQNPSYCHHEIPFVGNLQVKLNGSYPLPAGFSVSGNYQNTTGAMVMAVWNAPNAAVAPSLGRNLAACGTQATCTATVAVPLIRPGTVYEKRRNQLDLRLDKSIALARGLRFTGTVAVYNVLNSNAISSIRTTYGAEWLRPTAVLYARLAQVSGRLDF